MMRKIMAEEEQMTTASGDPHPAAGIADMIDLAYAQDFNKATEIFNDQIGQRMTAALDQEKIAIADQIFNDKEEIDDEELEASDKDDGQKVKPKTNPNYDETNIDGTHLTNKLKDLKKKEKKRTGMAANLRTKIGNSMN